MVWQSATQKSAWWWWSAVVSVGRGMILLEAWSALKKEEEIRREGQGVG